MEKGITTFTDHLDTWALNITNSILNSHKDKNIVTSTLSIYIAMAMLAEGLSNNSLVEVKKLFNFGDDILSNDGLQVLQKIVNRSDIDISLANAIFTSTNFPVEKDYVSLLAKKYNAACQSVDFGQKSELEKVNEWVRKSTNGLIKDVITDPDPLIVLMLANAIYFKGKWNKAFKTTSTTQLPFLLANNKEISVDTMQTKDKFRGRITEQYKMLELEYKEGNAAMVIVMPHEVGSQLNLPMQDIYSVLDEPLQSSRVCLPKFEISFEQELKDHLNRLGLKSLFIPSSTDFVNITKTEQVYVSSILQKAYIKVDEQGTEAAAVTTVTVRTKCKVIDRPLTIDKPFYYYIVDKNLKVTLFNGYIANPSQK